MVSSFKHTALGGCMNVKELHSKCVVWEFNDLAEELLDVLDSVIYYNAPVNDAQDAVEHLSYELEELIEQAKHTPTAAELACKFGGFECQDCE